MTFFKIDQYLSFELTINKTDTSIKANLTSMIAKYTIDADNNGFNHIQCRKAWVGSNDRAEHLLISMPVKVMAWPQELNDRGRRFSQQF